MATINKRAGLVCHRRHNLSFLKIWFEELESFLVIRTVSKNDMILGGKGNSEITLLNALLQASSDGRKLDTEGLLYSR